MFFVIILTEIMEGPLTMKYILMNKNTEVLIVEYNTDFNIFDRMYEIVDIYFR